MTKSKKSSKVNKHIKNNGHINGCKKACKRSCTKNKEHSANIKLNDIYETASINNLETNDYDMSCDSDSNKSALETQIKQQQLNDCNTLMGTISSLFNGSKNINSTSTSNKYEKYVSRWLPSWLCTGSSKSLNSTNNQDNTQPIITNLETSAAADVYIPHNKSLNTSQIMKITSNTKYEPHLNSHSESRIDTICPAPPPHNEFKKPGVSPSSSTLSSSANYVKRQYSNNSISSNGSNSSNNSNVAYNRNRRKKSIPKTVRRKVWEKVHGEHKAKGKCYVKWCQRILDKMDFQAGHNIPESKGGSIHITNLFPICGDCNQGMGDRFTIDEWSDMAFMDSIHEDFQEHISIKEWERMGDFVRKFVKLYPNILD